MLKYTLRASGLPAINIVSSASGSDHLVNVAPATSVLWTPATYSWQSYVTHSDGRRFTVSTGTMVVRPDFATAATVDGRSFARRMLAAIEATLEGNASKEESTLSLPDGRQVGYVSKTELIKWLSFFQQQVASEEAADNIKKGLGTGSRVLVRFSRP